MKEMIFSTLLLTAATASACLSERQAGLNVTAAFSNKIAQNCELQSINEQKVAHVICGDNNYRIALSNNEVFVLVFSQQKRNAIHQCYHTGQINSSCEVVLNDRQCDTVFLD